MSYLPFNKVMILMLLVTLSPLGIDLHLPALVTMQQDFGITANAAQLSVMIFVFSMGIGQLFCGFLVSWRGKYFVGFLGIVLFTLASLLIVLAPHYYGVLVGRVCQGLGASAASVIAAAAVNENYHGDEAAKLFALQGGCLNIIPSVAPVLGAFLLLLGWQAIFCFFIIYGTLLLVVYQRTFDFPEPSEKNAFISAVSIIAMDKTFWVYTSVCVLGLGYIMTYLNAAPIVLMRNIGLSALQFSLFFCFNAALIAGVSFSLVYFIKCFGRWKCIIIGLMLIGLSSLLLWWASPIQLVWVFAGLIGLGSIGFAFSFGAAMSFALANHREHSGVASGLLGCLYLSLSSLLAFLILYDQADDTANFGRVLLLLTVIVLLLMIGLRDKKHL